MSSAGVAIELVQEQGELVAARDAGRAPEIDDHGPAVEVGQGQRGPIEGRPRERRCRRVLRDPGSVRRRRSAARPGQGHDREDHACREDGHGDGDEHRPTARVHPRERDRAPYLTVIVPVMLATGWIEQMKTYVPGARPVYW